MGDKRAYECNWQEKNKHNKKFYRRHILKNPYRCDNCGDTYNKNDLDKEYKKGEILCPNCIQEYINNGY